MRKLWTLAVIAPLALVAGCATKGDVDSLRQEIAGVRATAEAADQKATAAQAASEKAAADAARCCAAGADGERQVGPDLPRGFAEVGPLRPLRSPLAQPAGGDQLFSFHRRMPSHLVGQVSNERRHGLLCHPSLDQRPDTCSDAPFCD